MVDERHMQEVLMLVQNDFQALETVPKNIKKKNILQKLKDFFYQHLLGSCLKKVVSITF